jgi:hypothetical protein
VNGVLVAGSAAMRILTHSFKWLKLASPLALLIVLLGLPQHAAAQSQAPPTTATGSPQNQPPAVQRAEAEVESAVRRWRVGVQGGVGLDPEILDVGIHAEFGPIFRRNIVFRPVFEIGAGEITTTVGLNLDVVYYLPGYTRDTRWRPYIGAGPHFGLSHQALDVDDDSPIADIDEEDRNRFDFSDTDFDGGMNFIVGMRKESGTFFEMKATAWGVSNIRLLVGFNF